MNFNFLQVPYWVIGFWGIPSGFGATYPDSFGLHRQEVEEKEESFG